MSVINNYYFGGDQQLPLSVETNPALNLLVGNHYVYTGGGLANWSLPPASLNAGKTIPVTNQTATSNLNVNVQGGLPEIYQWGAPSLNTNVMPNSTIYFKCINGFWYAT